MMRYAKCINVLIRMALLAWISIMTDGVAVEVNVDYDFNDMAVAIWFCTNYDEDLCCKDSFQYISRLLIDLRTSSAHLHGP